MRGFSGSSISMMRAAPTLLATVGGLKRKAKLVELQQVRPAVAGEGLGVLRDGGGVPGDAADVGDLRVRLARLDVADIHDPYVGVDRVSLIKRVAVVGDAQPVRVVGAAPHDIRLRGIADIHGQDVARAAGDPVGVAVRAEAAFVPEGDGALGLEYRVAAVLADVVDGHRAGQRQAVARVRDEQSRVLHGGSATRAAPASPAR